MVAVCVGAIGATAAVAASLGGDSSTITKACAAVAAGALATFLPLLLSGFTSHGASNFGVFVMLASGARTLVILGAALFFSQSPDVAKSPLWLGALTGAGLILVVETALSVALLSRAERAKSAGRSTASGRSDA